MNITKHKNYSNSVITLISI